MEYDFATATAVCNDAVANTWEVRAKGSDGKFWTVSDSSAMTEGEATSLAESMRSQST